MPQTDKKADALAFLMSHKTGVLSTISPEGTPRGRLVYYGAEDSFRISFMTLGNTRKVADLKANNKAAFTITDEVGHQTLQMEGTVDDLTETATIDDSLVRLTETWFSDKKYGAPLTRLDAGVIRYYRFTPNVIRWGDFTSGERTADVITDIPVS